MFDNPMDEVLVKIHPFLREKNPTFVMPNRKFNLSMGLLRITEEVSVKPRIWSATAVLRSPFCFAVAFGAMLQEEWGSTLPKWSLVKPVFSCRVLSSDKISKAELKG